jgi:hypothetical protein
MPALPDIPSYLLRYVTPDEISSTIPDARRRLSPESGPPLMHRAYSLTVRPISFRIVTDRDGMAMLRNFWTHDLAGGVKPFVMHDLLLHGATLTDENGNDLVDDGSDILNSAPIVVQFDEPPRESVFGRNTMYVSVSLSLFELPVP